MLRHIKVSGFQESFKLILLEIEVMCVKSANYAEKNTSYIFR